MRVRQATMNKLSCIGDIRRVCDVQPSCLASAGASMNPIPVSRYIHWSATVALIFANALSTLHAQPEQVPEAAMEPSCSVSDQDIVAATAGQNVALETPGCTGGLNHMVDVTVTNINKLYAAFYGQGGLGPSEMEAVSRLLARRQLLSTGWSADHAEHLEVDKDSALLSEVDARLREHLTSQQLASLKTYERTTPARHLLDPAATRLARRGRPLSEAQWAAVVPAVQRFFEDWLKSPPNTSTDSVQRCTDNHARMNQRDEHVHKILAASLDEEQREIAQAYYRDLFERRARRFHSFQEGAASGAEAFCTIPAN